MKEITLYFLLLLVSEADPPFLTYKGYDAYYTKQQCMDLGKTLKKNLESLSIATDKKIIEIKYECVPIKVIEQDNNIKA
tara:strand:- start:236 stop:472 length:237 start_codon:yes stop_codon:yes gene_type:complete